jgi:small subunit ribosomal protein S20
LSPCPRFSVFRLVEISKTRSDYLVFCVIIICLTIYFCLPKRNFFKTTVANTKSAIKRIQIAERNRLRNKAYKSAVKTLMKKYLKAVETYANNPTPEAQKVVNEAMAAAYSKIDKAVKRNVLHSNNGARKKARLAKALAQVTAAAS